MSNMKPFMKRLDKLGGVIAPRPRLIDCTGAREELLTMLQVSMTDDERNEVVEITPAVQAEFEALSDMLDRSVARIERDFNVRLISYDR